LAEHPATDDAVLKEMIASSRAARPPAAREARARKPAAPDKGKKPANGDARKAPPSASSQA
jgi:hypothetical protein